MARGPRVRVRRDPRPDLVAAGTFRDRPAALGGAALLHRLLGRGGQLQGIRRRDDDGPRGDARRRSARDHRRRTGRQGALPGEPPQGVPRDPRDGALGEGPARERSVDLGGPPLHDVRRRRPDRGPSGTSPRYRGRDHDDRPAARTHLTAPSQAPPPCRGSRRRRRAADGSAICGQARSRQGRGRALKAPRRRRHKRTRQGADADRSGGDRAARAPGSRVAAP